MVGALADEALAGLRRDGDPDDDLALGEAAQVDREAERLALDGAGGDAGELDDGLDDALDALEVDREVAAADADVGEGSVAICVIGTGLGAGGVITGGLVVGGGVVGAAVTLVVASGSAGAASRPQLASSALRGEAVVAGRPWACR